MMAVVVIICVTVTVVVGMQVLTVTVVTGTVTVMGAGPDVVGLVVVDPVVVGPVTVVVGGMVEVVVDAVVVVVPPQAVNASATATIRDTNSKTSALLFIRTPSSSGFSICYNEGPLKKFVRARNFSIILIGAEMPRTKSFFIYFGSPDSSA